MRLLFCLLIASITARQSAADETAPGSMIRFRKIVLTDKYYCDGIQAGDIDRDGHTDIVAGPFWYGGPTFEIAHEFYPPVPLVPERSPSDSMFSFVHDFSGDGWPDILVLGRVHLHPAWWYENPGAEGGGDWEKHFAFERVRGESPAMVDLDGDGRPQVICHWDGRWGWIEPDVAEPRRPWRFQPVSANEDWPQFYHGEGVADINGDGGLDIVINDGWYEQPGTNSRAADWTFHRLKFSAGRGGAQMFGDDIDGDGDTDVVSALDAHGWGLAWFEQVQGDGEPRFAEHTIMGDRSQLADYGAAFTQPHALDVADIDGDGLKDVVVGKRMWAHGPTGDIEPNAPPVVYWFRLKRSDDGEVKYIPQLVDAESGVGVQIQAVDVNADGRTDILTASKLGSFVFLNLGE